MAKYLLTSDWHVTDKKPERRLDANYLETILGKIKHIFDTARRTTCSAVIIAGDIFNSAKTNYYTYTRLLELRNMYADIRVYVIYGQHDMYYHSQDVSNTPLHAFIEAGGAFLLRTKPPTDLICGVSWEQEIPTDSKAKILVLHATVSNKVEMFDTLNADALLKKHTQFDLILCGDNHKSFVIHNKDRSRWLVNPGSLMRTAIDQLEHQPFCYIYDTDKKEVMVVKIPVRPATDVFDTKNITEEKEHNAELEAFIEGLHDDIELQGLDYVQNLKDFVKKERTEKSITSLIFDEILGGK